MYGGIVQHLGAFRHPEEAGALLVCLCAQLRHLEKLLAAPESPFGFAVRYDVLCHGGIYAGNVGKEGHRCGVKVNAYAVHAVLHHPLQRFVQPLLGHVVLILANAYALWVYLYKLRQRVLQPSGDGHCAPQGYIVIRELLRAQPAGGVHRCPRFADYNVLYIRAFYGIRSELFRFTAGGAIAYGYDLHVVLLYEPRDDALRFGYFIVGRRRVYDGGIQHLARLVHYRHLAAGAVARVQPHGHHALYRGLHEQRLQVHRKGGYGLLAGFIGEHGAELAGNGRIYKPAPRVLCRGFHLL